MLDQISWPDIIMGGRTSGPTSVFDLGEIKIVTDSIQMSFSSRSTESPSPPKAAAVASVVSPHVDEPLPGYRLTWSDEFDQPGQPDPAKWGYEEGFIRNNERQLYVRDRRENARVEDGVLVIEARKEQFAIPHRTWFSKYARYTSASLFSKESWQYGRIEVRAKLPYGKGTWPAIWMLGTSGWWPACGECDILEHVGRQPGYIHTRVHFGRNLLLHRSNGSSLKVDTPWEDFHTYTMGWSRDEIAFFFDETLSYRFNIRKADRRDGTNPFRQPHHLKINVALGSWAGPIDDAIFPQRLLVDYVRVYQKADT